eukprot:9903148-Karenia_brevis.AAC.1
MLEELVFAAGEAGLGIHMGKTKALTIKRGCAGGTINIFDKQVQILAELDATEYLGRQVVPLPSA